MTVQEGRDGVNDYPETLIASIYFGPAEIRAHYEGDDPPDPGSCAEWVNGNEEAGIPPATDEQLTAVGEAARDAFLGTEAIWREFHDVLGEAIEGA